MISARSTQPRHWDWCDSQGVFGGCSSLTGVEAIANAVPHSGRPSVKRAQHTEVALGLLLAAMLFGLAVLIRLHGVVPRGNVTVLAQLSAGAFGTGWPFYVINLSVTLVLAFAANTSFGGLPVLMQLLAKDHRLPHLFTLRAESPCSGTALHGVGAAVRRGAAHRRCRNPEAAAGIRDRRLHRIHDQPNRTGPALAATPRPSAGWATPLLNGTGAVLTAVAGMVLLASKFTEGAWLLLLLVPGLMLLLDRIERYYQYASPNSWVWADCRPSRCRGPTGEAWSSSQSSRSASVAGRALQVAMRLGGEMVPVTVDIDPESTQRLCEQWQQWDPGVELTGLPSPHRTLVAPTVGFVQTQVDNGRDVTVLLSQVEPRHWRHRMLYNQRGPILEAALRARTSAIIASVSVRLD